MLQRLLDLKPEVLCDTVHGALTGIVQQLLVTGHAAVDLVGRATDRPAVDARTAFDRVCSILVQSHFIDADTPVSETRAGIPKIRVPNPYYRSLHLPVRLRIDSQSEPAAVLLHAFLVLRVRYQTTVGSIPTMRLETSTTDDFGLDVLYLAADSFTERYPLTADIAKNGEKVTLTLTGEPMLVVGGLTWARDDYVRCRDTCLLIRPLREALDGPTRPLVVPREVRGALGGVRVRLPEQARERTKSVRWLGTIQELRHPAGGAGVESPGPVGEHFSVTPATGGYIAAGGEAGTDAILSVRCLASTGPREVIVPEGDDGSVAIALEAIGGAREIGANSYYYAFGHRGVLVDAGFDATRDGWLGLPAFERLFRVDAIVLTHAHLDHIGAVPILLAAFPNVPVFCTRATLAVLLPQLADSAKVSELRFQQTGEAPALLRGLVDSIRPEQFRLLDYRVRSAIPEIPGLTVEFFDAGHTIGSACARFEFADVTILHTGDISVEDQHLLRGMPVAEVAADHVVMEGTYGGDPGFDRAHRRAAVDEFLVALAERIDAGGSVLLPAFSLGKAQELVALLVSWSTQNGRSIPIWTVGMVNRINEVSGTHASFLPKVVGKPFTVAKPFPALPKGIDNVERSAFYAQTFFELANNEACVVIASHGMMAEGTGSYLIGRAILGNDDQRHAILLTGYMDPRSPGFRLSHQRGEAVIDFGPGDAIKRRIPSERIQFHRLTSHASYEELVDVAVSVPSRSVTLIHGEGQGLDGLVRDIRQRLDALGRDLVLRAPAIGERVLIERVSPPESWDVETEPADELPSLGSGRKFDRATGLSVRGLTADRRWALIPVGQASVTLALESNRIDPSRIDRLDLRRERGNTRVVFDRARGDGDVSRIVLTEPGKFALTITVRDPSGQIVRADLPVSCGAEIRAIRTTLEAARPVLELEVGGTFDPEVFEITAERNDWRLDHEDVSWEPISRVLRIRLKSSTVIGTIEDVQLRIRWPNGFIQSGPSLAGFTLEPRVDFEPGPAKVGVPSRVRVRSTPAPVRARVGGQIYPMDDDGVVFVPNRPGVAAVELEYATLDGDREWREIGSLHVQAAARMDLPTGTDMSNGLQVTIRDVEPTLNGAELALCVGGETRDQWTAGGAHAWSGDVPDTDPLDVAVLAPAKGLTLCAGSVRVYSGLEFDAIASLPVTTTNGACEAELVFVGPSGWNRRVVEDAFSAAGFVVRGWVNGALRVTGSDRTVGSHIVSIADGSRKMDVRVVTLSDMHLSLAPGGTLEPGDGCTVHTSGGEITAGLAAIDGGPLVIEAERVDPFFDELSARVIGNRVQLLHPGRYVVSLIASGRRLARVDAIVEARRRPPVVSAPARIEHRAQSAYDASVAAAGCTACACTVILSPPRDSYRIVQDQTSETEELVWRFLGDRLAARENVLVSWPGLALGELGGRLLRRLRADQPSIPVAHMSYPAPRGEMASDEAHARTLREHRVLCCARASATIDRLDAYRCVKCDGSPRLKTDSSRIWQECPNCGYADSELVLTLVGLRSTDVRVLFADYRIAKYLSHGRGRRYAGAFGRSVRCGNCYRLQTANASPIPWDRTDLRNLVSALASTWDGVDQARSIRRAAYIVARRAHRSRPSDLVRLEDALHRLIDAGLVQDGRAVDQRQFNKLEAGVSLCCERPLVWSIRRATHVFLDVEELLDPALPASTHPDLAFGQGGVRQFLALSE